MELDPKTFRLSGTKKLSTGFLVVGVIALVISLIGLFTNKDQFYYSTLTSWLFWLTIALGGLFFVMLHHLVNAVWSIVLRRIVETTMMALPRLFLFTLLFILPFTGIHSLYEWADGVAKDHHMQYLLDLKTGWWLNIPFFIGRTVVYVVALSLLACLLYRLSIKQDSGHTAALEGRFKSISAPGMLVFALVLTFLSFDYIMSLDFKWFSTIFGVYVFSGTVVAILSFTTLMALFLRSRGMLQGSITVEHYHDLGKLIFAFLVFWAYIAFSQFFLIWYGNIPEETDWYIKRFEGSWGTMGMVILLGHFLVPFLVLLSRGPKRNPKVLCVMAVWMLIMHWIDLHWLIMPNLHEQLNLSWMDFTTFIGIGGLFLWFFWRQLASHPILPVRDPQLEKSMQFTNT